MIELIVTICLAAQPQVCAPHLLPQPAPMSEPQCRQAAPDRLSDWQAANPGLTVTSWDCATPDIPALSVTQIAPGIWVHKGLHQVPTPDNAGDLANIGFVVGDTSVAVIDAGGSRDVAERLLMAIRQVTDLPVGWLVLSHMHPDHTMGASLFRDMGVPILGHRDLPDALANRFRTYDTNYGRLIGPERMILSNVIAPATITTGVAQIDLGGRLLDLTEVETAHTDNDLTVFDPATGTLWMADLVFAEHTPALDGSILGWLSVLTDMQSFQADRVVPGHGPVSLSWPDGMQATRNYLAAIADETRAAIASGESLSDAIKHVGESQRGDWLLFDEFNPRNATAAFTELEWE